MEKEKKKKLVFGGILLLCVLIGVVCGMGITAYQLFEKMPVTEYSSWYSIDKMISGEPYFDCRGIYQLSDPSYFCCKTDSIHNKGMDEMCFQIEKTTSVCIWDSNDPELRNGCGDS